MSCRQTLSLKEERTTSQEQGAENESRGRTTASNLLQPINFGEQFLTPLPFFPWSISISRPFFEA